MSRFDVRRLRSRDELTATVKGIAQEAKKDDIATLSAAVAFKIMFALFPALLAGIAIFGLFTDPSDLTKLLDDLRRVAPEGVVDFLERPLLRLTQQQATAGGVAIAGVVGGIWVATSAAVTLNRALSLAYDTRDERKLMKARAAALIVTIALLLALVLIFVVLVVGGPLENRILSLLPLTDTARSVADVVSTVLRYLLSLLALMILFGFIYWVGPHYRERPPYPWISPGAVVGVVSWLVASALFSWYVSTFGNFSGPGSVYGPLANAILFMLWLQLTMFALLLGAEVNQVLRVQANTSQAPVSAQVRPAPDPR